MTVFLVISTLFVAFIFWWYLKYWNVKKLLKKYPGPTPFPIIGNAHLFSSPTRFMSESMRLCKQYGGTIKVMIGFIPKLLIADCKLNEIILSSNTLLEKSFEYKFVHSWLGSGLLTASAEKWKKHRKLITPTFNFRILEQFIDVFNTQSTILVNKLSPKVGKESFDIFPYVTFCTLDIICEAAMGTSINAQDDLDSEYVRAMSTVFRIMMERSFNPIKMWDFVYTFTNDYYLEQAAIKTLHSFANSVIKNRKQVLLVNNANNTLSVDEETGIKRRLAFLDLLLQCNVDGNPLSDECIREEVDTFMFAGFETAASAISFTLYCLAHNPDIQQKVVEELKEIFCGDKNKPATLKNLQDMKYLDMVLKESMRVYPPVPAYSRTLEEDLQFEGEILPKGLSLTFCPFILHKNEEIFPDPDKFDPERFSMENSTGRPPYCYIPFSAGPRNCIGQRFAMLEMKSTLAQLLRNFEIFPEPDHVPILAALAVLKSQNGLPLKLKKRDF